jgi:hypothetical protein
MTASPRRQAKTAGLFYLITIVVGIYAQAVLSRLIVSGDAEATARNVIASEFAYRSAFVADLIGGASYLVVTVLLYVLLKPVSKNLSLLAALFSIVGVAGALNALNGIAPLLLLGGAHYLSAFQAQQLAALAYTFVRMHGQGYNISLVYFGCYCALIGYLIVRSTFLPRTIGVLMVLAGICYLINSFAGFLSPPLANGLFPFILLPCLIGEGALMLWLILFGVNVPAWERLADHGAVTI